MKGGAIHEKTIENDTVYIFDAGSATESPFSYKFILNLDDNTFKTALRDYIKKDDIWNYLKITKWSKANNLLLYQMVDDILNLDNIEIDDYVKGELRKKVIKPDLENMKWDDGYGKKEEEFED